MSTITTPLLTAGWFRAMRTTLGLSIEQMADILDVRDDTIRKAWEGGETRIPAGVRDEIAGLIEYTNNATKYLATRAANFVYPCIIVYRKYSDVPSGHIAVTMGLEWWSRVAYNAASAVDPGQSMMIGTMDEVAEWLDEPEDVTVDELHERGDVMGLYTLDVQAVLPGLTHERQ